MKIAVLSSTIFPVGANGRGLEGYGGLEQVAWQVADGLVRRGHDVTLYAPDGSSLDGGTVRTYGPAGRVDERRAYKSYWSELPSYDCLVDHTWAKWSYMLKAEGVLNSPVLGVMHAPVDTMVQKPPPVDKPCIVCISRDQARHWEALHPKVGSRVAHNGIDLEHYRVVGVPRTDRFLFLARFSTIKGPDLAIKAARQAQVGLDLVGDTSITNEPEFFQMCAAQCDDSRVRMVGPATRGGTVWWYSQATCMLHPNERFREPFGLAVVESQACGTPVVAWRYGSLPEVVDHGRTGFLAGSFEEFVGRVMEFRDMCDADKRTVRDNCVEWARQFSVQNMVDRYESLCDEAVESGGW